MAVKDYVNLFYLNYDANNAIKKKDLVDYIEKMKGKVVADKQIQNLCNETANLSVMLTVLWVPIKDSPVSYLS